MQDTFIKFFHQTTCDNVVSTDKMMIRARGPVWHRKQQQQGIIPTGLTGLDTEATWSYSKSDGLGLWPWDVLYGGVYEPHPGGV